MIDPKMIGATAALSSAASWSIGAIISRKLSQAVAAPALTWAKAIISIVLMLPVLAIVGFQPLTHSGLSLLILSGVLGIAVSDTLFFAAIRHLGARDMVLLLAIGQVFTILLSVVFLHERPLPLEWLGIAGIIVGVMIVLQSSMSEPGSSGTRGIIFGLFSALAMSVSQIIIKPVINDQNWQLVLEAALIRIAVGAVGMTIVGLAGQSIKEWVKPLRDRKLAGLLVISACVVTFGGFYLSQVAIAYGKVSVNSTLISTEPLFAMFLAAWLLKEKITTRAATGTAVTMAGIISILKAGR